jgi:hypothetical protein
MHLSLLVLSGSHLLLLLMIEVLLLVELLRMLCFPICQRDFSKGRRARETIQLDKARAVGQK